MEGVKREGSLGRGGWRSRFLCNHVLRRQFLAVSLSPSGNVTHEHLDHFLRLGHGCDLSRHQSGGFFRALYASRRPTLRRPFYYLAIAAALSAFCSAITLFLRLHQSFPFSFVTVELRRGLLLPHDLAEISSVVIYCFGFISLAYRVGRVPLAPPTAPNDALRE